MTESQELCVIYVSQGPLQAELIKGKLEAAGIPVLLRYEAIGRILGLTVDGLGRVEVLVSQEAENAARDIISEWDMAASAGGEEPSSPPACAGA